ncbi:ABC-type nitrate/sulfonate/bicarbonate transport system, substrate-binding protein [Pseudonocardia thermophila]|uniref:Thiamine pyrimidine synthase n=1 Tax=Pseudonocardia thermophila TaxID=1848 RepID=A0A1M6U794_PSETH|nr:ABC transporter substrate-binding protein [Pseudonocardia thermophila]SHK65031.1 ABC-type nitrate/sulfonate/bicarbonate transport system, substrate-binding protein [Pseudonocardia thermophila]
MPLRARRAWLTAAVGVVTALLATACGGSSSSADVPAGGPTPLKMAFEWTCSGDWSVVYSGLEQKIFEKHGLALTYDRGQGGSDTVPMVAAGEFDVGLLGAAPTIIGAGQGLPITIVGAAATSGPVTILASPDIKQPADLEGRSLAVQTDQFEGAMWEAYVKATGIDGSKVEVIPADDATTAEFLAGKIDALVVFYPTASTQAVLAARPDLTILPMQDHVPAYGHLMVANNRYLAEHPDAVRGFVTAWSESAKWVVDHWDQAYQLLVSKCPEVDPAALKFSMEAYFDGYTGGYAKEHGIGTFEIAGIEKTQEVLESAGLAKDRPTAEFVSLDYLPSQPIMP